MNAENWGVTTQNEENVYLHLLDIPATKEIFIPGNYQIAKIKGMNFNNPLTVNKKEGGVSIQIHNFDHSIVDQIIILPKLIK
jgi:hypothetical protein